MTEEQHLLTILAEECAESIHRVSKILRFGLDDIEPGQKLTNAERLSGELIDLKAMIEMVEDKGILSYTDEKFLIAYKKAKVLRYIEYSKELGTCKKPY